MKTSTARTLAAGAAALLTAPVLAQDANIEIVMTSFSPVPGFPEGARYGDAPGESHTELSNAGLAYYVWLNGPAPEPAGHRLLIHRDGFSTVALKFGQQAPGFSEGVLLGSFGTPFRFDDQGRYAVRVGVYQEGVPDSAGSTIYTGTSASTPTPVIRTGDPLPGLGQGDAIEYALPPGFADGLLAIRAGAFGPGVTPETDEVLGTQDNTGALRLIIRENEQVPDQPPGVALDAFVFGLPSRSDDGRVVTWAALRGTGVDETSDAIYLGYEPGAGVSTIARRGSDAPGFGFAGDEQARYGEFDIYPVFLRNGRMAFRTELSGGPADDPLEVGVLAGDPFAGLAPVASNLSPVPGQPAGSRFVDFGQPVLAEGDHIAFTARVAPPAPGEERGAIVAARPGDEPRVLAIDGDQAPGLPGGVSLEDLGSAKLAMNRLGELAAVSRISTGPSDYGYFLFGPDGSARVLVATGDVIEDGEGVLRTVTGFAVNTPQINDHGEVLIKLVLDNSNARKALVLASAPCPADADGDGSVNVLDLVAFINTWYAQGDGSDANGDGAVDILDVVAFIDTWNAGCP